MSTIKWRPIFLKSYCTLSTNEVDDFQDLSFGSGIQSWLYIKIHETRKTWHFVAVEEYVWIYLFVLQIYFIKYYLNLARSTKKFTEMFQKLRPKFQLLVEKEINVCSNCLDFNSSFLLFFQYLGKMFQLLGLGCSNYWELKWDELSCLLIQQLLVESKKLDL